MPHLLSFAVDIILAGYIVWEVVRFPPRYRRLKQDIVSGVAGARLRMYRETLAFEWISALLALLALGFDWSKLNPKALDLDHSPLLQQFSTAGGVDPGLLTAIVAGLAGGIVFGLIGIVVIRLRANRLAAKTAAGAPAAAAAPDAPHPWWRKLMPDFDALVPVTPRERLVFAAVAISAGICEEIVFRGWLLGTLHGTVGLHGTALILVAAAMFGLAHTYQRITGMLLTGIVGAVFCVLYAATGSLLVPIALHILMDVRFALIPARRKQSAASFSPSRATV
jgi:membrane protease YdiL (CAAX protease family)